MIFVSCLMNEVASLTNNSLSKAKTGVLSSDLNMWGIGFFHIHFLLLVFWSSDQFKWGGGHLFEDKLIKKSLFYFKNAGHLSRNLLQYIFDLICSLWFEMIKFSFFHICCESWSVLQNSIRTFLSAWKQWKNSRFAKVQNAKFTVIRN